MTRPAASDGHIRHRFAPEYERAGIVERLRRMRDAVHRAFREFLAVPTIIIVAFLVLAVLVDAADRRTPAWLAPARDFLKQRLFVNADMTSDVLAAVAATIITVTSIIVSVLLLAVQQSAASMSTAVFDLAGRTSRTSQRTPSASLNSRYAILRTGRRYRSFDCRFRCSFA